MDNNKKLFMLRNKKSNKFSKTIKWSFLVKEIKKNKKKTICTSILQANRSNKKKITMILSKKIIKLNKFNLTYSMNISKFIRFHKSSK